MSAQTREASPPRHRFVPFQPWLILSLVAVLVAGMGISIYRVVRSPSDGTPISRGASVTAELSGTYGSRPVTGTGPGLVEVAQESQSLALPAITGTGPGLVEVAQESQSLAQPAITGTGPGLVWVTSGRS